MLNHYQIMRIEYNEYRSIQSKNVEFKVTCTLDEVYNIVIPLFDKYAQSINKYYRVIGSNKIVTYEVETIEGLKVENLVNVINGRIKGYVKTINQTIDERNRIAKRANKLCNRKLDENMLEHIKELDYLYIG